jgi:hypothetical protein
VRTRRAIGAIVDRQIEPTGSEPHMPHTNAMTMPHARRIRTIALGALAALVASAGPAAEAQAQSVTGAVAADWTTVSSTMAAGTLLGGQLTLSGSRVTTLAEGAVIDGRSTYFAGSAFSPALPKTDMMQIFGPPAGPYPANPYTIKLDVPVKDPLLYIGSLASKLVFSGASATKRSGSIVVAGSTISSYPLNATPPSVPPDADGTIRLSGTFGNGVNGYPAISFTASQPPWASWASPDGIFIQVAALAECADWTAAGTNIAGASLLGASLTMTREPSPDQRYPLSDGSRLDGGWSGFAAQIFSPALPLSDAVQMTGPRKHGAVYRYTIGFGSPKTRPILHLGSLASAITFGAGAPVTALSRESADFQVAGATVTGKLVDPIGPYGLNDVSGTVMLSGTLSSIGFEISNPYADALQEDGIYLQVCAAV